MGRHTHSISVKAAITDLEHNHVAKKNAELKQFLSDGDQCNTARGWIFTGWAADVTDGHDTLFCEEITYLEDSALCEEYRRLDDIYQDGGDKKKGNAALKVMESMTAGKPVVYLLNKEFGISNYWTILSPKDKEAVQQFASDWKIDKEIVQNLAITQTI